MKKVKIILLIGAALIFFARTSSAIFDSKKNKETEEKSTGAKITYEKLAEDYERLKQQVQEMTYKYANLVKENEALNQDRDNLMTQAKKLLGESGRAEELEETIEKLGSEKCALEEEAERLSAENMAITNELQEIKAENESMTKEVNNFKSGAVIARKDAEMKRLKEDRADLKKRESVMKERLAKVEKAETALMEENSKLEKIKSRLEEELAKYKKNYETALRKNRAFEADLEDMPKKFSEIARQNKQLMKDTSTMHYNLGVFYVKSREYGRARAEFEKAIEINPDDASAHFNLGYIYAEYIVKRDKAVQHFKDYLRLSKSDDEDVNWAKKYILTWQTFEGKETMK